MPPFGNLYGMPVYVDTALSDYQTIRFEAGTYTDTLCMRYADYINLVNPIALQPRVSAGLMNRERTTAGAGQLHVDRRVRSTQRMRRPGPRARVRQWLLWTPRVMLLVFVALLALFSLDVFAEGRGPTEILIGLLIHNLPGIALLAAAVAAWRRPWVGALAMVAFAVWWLATFGAVGFPSSVYLLLVGIPLMIAGLFLLSWRMPDHPLSNVFGRRDGSHRSVNWRQDSTDHGSVS